MSRYIVDKEMGIIEVEHEDEDYKKEQEAIIQANKEKREVQSAKRKRNKKIKNIILIAIAVVLVLVLAVGGFLFFRMNSLQTRLDEGDAYLAAEQYEDAINSYNAALAIMDDSADAYLGLAQAYIGLGDLDKALQILEEGIAKTGSENLVASKELVFDQVFATYVMNFYSLNLLPGQTEQLIVEPKSKDMNFEVSFSSTDDSIATVSDDGIVSAKKNGMTEITANIGNDIWGHRDIPCMLTVGVVKTFLEEAGCEYLAPDEEGIAPSYTFQADEEGLLLDGGNLLINQNDASYKITKCTMSDPDVKGNVTYNVTLQVTAYTEFGIVPDTPETENEWYYDWITTDMFVCDEYTGIIINEQDLYGYEKPVIDSEITFNKMTYNIKGEVTEEWVNEENWKLSLDEKGVTWAKAPVIGTFEYTLTVPREYQGLVLLLDKNGVKEYKEEEDDASVAKNEGFFDKREDGTVRKANDFYAIRLIDYVK